MATPTTINEFLELVRKSTVVDEKRLDAYLERQQTQANVPIEVGKYAGVLVRDGVLTQFQAEQFLLGKWRRFTIGKYKVLERIGSGGMGSVFLCEHKLMRRRVAIKVLPTAKAEEPSALERFQREARVVAALDHPNIVRAYDIDEEDKLHFLVMEYIDGSSLQEIVKRHGALSVLRACHYIRQSAAGLHHAYQVAHIVHRDIKPGNILVDRAGVVKILDMGLARFFHDEEEILTKKYDENVLGTADYLAPEQAIDSHDVDIRADLYSLGATFYFCLTGNTPFNEGTVAQKLIWHQTRQPKPVRALRPEVPEGVAAIIEKLMAKDPNQRYQTPAEVFEALEPWTREPIGPPPEKEMPRLSPAASGTMAFGEPSLATPVVAGGGGSPSSVARRWAAAKPGTTPPPATPAPAPGAKPPAAKRQSSSVVRPPQTPGPRAEAAPRAAAPASIAADPAPADNGNLSWDKLAPDTADVIAHLDTAPHSAPKRRPLSATDNRRPALPKNWKLIAGPAAGGGALLMLLIWVAWPNKKPQAETTARLTREPAIVQVTRTGRPNSFKTIQEALAHAREGDRVVVLDDHIEEALHLENGRLGKGVTIEAGNPAKQVLWTAPAKATNTRFLAFSNVQGLHLKGFTIDGQSKVENLITVQGNCPGLVLEDLQLRGFTENGIVFWNCGGNSQQGPVKLTRLRVIAAPDSGSAFLFQAKENVAPPFNHHLLVSDCRFEGPCKAAVQLASSIQDLELRRNRFFQTNDGILYLKATPRYQLQLTLDSNTFYAGQAALHFESLPLTTNNSQVVVKNNLFGQIPVVAQVDDKQRLNEVGLICQFSKNVRDPGSQEGDIPLGTVGLLFTLPTKPDNDATFLRYPKTDRLAQAGLDLKPVGVPPAN
jgi:serine/threonine protein kinase